MMTWSFQIKNGDLNFAGPGGFATVTGQQKLVQDLKNWLLEPRGTDPFHPDFGCILDGGVDSNGSPIEGSIGSVITPEALLTVESEVRRVLGAYQQQQLGRLQREIPQYNGQNTFSNGEVLASVDDVQVIQLGDTVIVTCVITTGDGSALSFTQAVT